MIDDGTLLRDYAARKSDDPFTEIVRRHIDAVFSAALRRVGGDRHLAEDVTQAVFISLARKAATLARHPFLTGWLYLATRHEAANAVRAERRRRAREEEVQRMHTPSPDPDSNIDWRDVAPLLDAAIDELNPGERMAVLLRFVERRTFAEIGAHLGLSDDAARMRVDRALDKLRGRLARHGITSTAAALGAVMTTHTVGAAPVGFAATVAAAATAVGPAGAMATLPILMSTTKILITTVAIVTLAAVATLVHHVGALRETNEQIATAQAAQTALAAQLQKSEERLARALAEATELEAALEQARAPRPPPPAPPTPPTRATTVAAVTGPATPEAIAAGQALMERHPELKRAVVDYCSAMFSGMFGRLYRERQFNPAQIDQFERLMMMSSGVLRRVAGPDGQPMVIAGPGFGDAEQKRQAQAGLAWLGPDGMREARDASSQNAGVTLALQLAGALAFSATPLTQAQAQELARIVVAAGGRSGTGTHAWEPILAQSADLLSPPQLALLRGLQVQEQLQTSISAALRQAGQRNPPSGGKP